MLTILYLGGAQVGAGALTVGEFSSFLVYAIYRVLHKKLIPCLTKYTNLQQKRVDYFREIQAFLVNSDSLFSAN